MPTYSIGEALSLLLEKSKWKPKVTELRMRNEWEQITGKTIARYTRNIQLNDKKLTIYTNVAALRQELLLGKVALMATINKYFDEQVVTEIQVK
ncbi:MAG: DUF721 domain-containing protein [Bacteroidetes bacterium]|nr:DUF721 domain-containing protein [Bacteroidota bacterium]